MSGEKEEDMRLGEVTFDNDLYIAEFAASAVIATKEATIDGGEVIFAQANGGGNSIDLVGYENSGWLTYATLNQIKAMSQYPAGEYLLEKADGSTVLVRFRHEEAPVIDVTPLIERAEYDDTDYFYGTIKLAEVV